MFWSLLGGDSSRSSTEINLLAETPERSLRDYSIVSSTDQLGVHVGILEFRFCCEGEMIADEAL